MLAVFEYEWRAPGAPPAPAPVVVPARHRVVTRVDPNLIHWTHTLPGTWRKAPFGDSSGNWKERKLTLSCKRRDPLAHPNEVNKPTVRLAWSEDREEHGHGYLLFDRADVQQSPEPNGIPARVTAGAVFPAGACTSFNVVAPRYAGVGESTKLCVALHRATGSADENVGNLNGFLRIVKTAPSKAVAKAADDLNNAIAAARRNCM